MSTHLRAQIAGLQAENEVLRQQLQERNIKPMPKQQKSAKNQSKRKNKKPFLERLETRIVFFGIGLILIFMAYRIVREEVKPSTQQQHNEVANRKLR